MTKQQVAFIISAVNLGNYKNISELRGKLNPDNNNDKLLVDYLGGIEYGNKDN